MGGHEGTPNGIFNILRNALSAAHFQRLKASNGLGSLHFLSLMSRGALMLEPIDPPSPVQAARGVQKPPTCGQSRPASSARYRRATHNSERAGSGS